MTKSLTDKHGIGFGLEVNNFSMDGKTILKIKTNIATLALLKDRKTYVLIHQDGKYLINDLILDKNAPEQTLALQNTDLFSGINTIRIIDSNMKEWANRNFYNAPKKESTVALIKNIRKADKIEFSGYYNTPNTNLSISVLPTDSKSTTENYSIVAGLGINPYLSEPLINANYYLLQPKRITNYELDLFLINQDKLKYSWENIKSTKPTPNLTGMLGFGGSGNESQTSTQPQSNVVDNVLGLFNPMSQLASMLPNNQPNFDLLSSLDKQTEPSAARNIQTAAINSELSKNYSVSQNNTQTQASISNPAPIENADNKRSGVASASSYSSSPSWYLQLAGRISNDETMKFRGGVFA